MPNNEKNAEPAVRDAQSTAARRRRRRHTPHGDAPCLLYTSDAADE